MVLLCSHTMCVFYQVSVKRERSPAVSEGEHHIKSELYHEVWGFFLSSFPFLGQMIQVFLSAFNLLPSERAAQGTAVL